MVGDHFLVEVIYIYIQTMLPIDDILYTRHSNGQLKTIEHDSERLHINKSDCNSISWLLKTMIRGDPQIKLLKKKRTAKRTFPCTALEKNMWYEKKSLPKKKRWNRETQKKCFKAEKTRKPP